MGQWRVGFCSDGGLLMRSKGCPWCWMQCCSHCSTKNLVGVAEQKNRQHMRMDLHARLCARLHVVAVSLQL